MKKIIKLILIIIAILLVFEILIFIFKTHHNIDYTVKNEKIKYKVNEVYKDKKYSIRITNKDKIYAFEVDNNFYKRKKIVKNIYTYNLGNVSCIYPKYKRDKASSNIICSRNNETYSYEYFKAELKPFIKRLKKDGFSNPSWKDKSNKQNRLDTLTIYPNNINEDTYIYIYNYKGFYSINNETSTNLKILKNDKYKNTLGAQVGKYYVIPNYDENHTYKHFYRIDMTKDKIKEFKVKKKVNSDSYVNGVIDDEMYIFDKDKLVQYKINPKKKKQKEVGNKEDKVLDYNLKFKRINVYKMRDEIVKFKTVDNYIDKLEGKANIKFIEKVGSTYYYQNINNDVYYYNANSKVKIHLFNKEISDFKLVGNTIYFISNDTLYSYNIDLDLSKLVIYSELSFNPENRIAVYKEE